MNNYPGEPPTPANQPGSGQPGDAGTTQEVGYWQSQAQGNEPTAPLPPQEPVWNPTTQQPYGTGQPPTQQPGPPAPPPPPAQQQTPYGAPLPPPPSAYGQPPVHPQVPMPAPGYSPMQTPVHPDANTALIVGIISLAGAFVCVLPLLASPFAWVMGSKALKTVRASNGQYRGESEARIGQVLGIIGTIFLILGILGFVLLMVLFAIGVSSADYSTGVNA